MITRSTLLFASLTATILFFIVPGVSFAATITVAMGDDFFNAKSVTVQPGDTVVWINNGSMAHTVTGDDGSWGSGNVAAGGQYSHTFTSAGTFAYHCAYHGAAGGVGMAGTITVAAPASPPPPPPPTPVPSPVPPPIYTQTSSQPAQTSGSPQSISTLQAEIQSLQQALQQAQQQKATAVTAPGASNSAVCAPIAKSLGQGSTGADVSSLQRFLARDPSIYPEAVVSGYYGALTTAAVKRFQIKYGIVSSGSPSTTGFGRVGPKTLAVINAQCGGSAGADVGAFMQVSPDQGSAPLEVNVQVTANTTNSCGAATYTLDYGDQSAPVSIPVPAGTCQPLQQTYKHTYTQKAQYEITLSAGDHNSQATVVVQ